MTELAIPRILHQIWLGSQTLPREFEEFQRGWMACHPGWRLRLWTERDLPTLRNRVEFEASATLAGRANILRYEILAAHGGVYVDTDFECRRNLEPLLEDADCFVARQSDDMVNNAIIGCVSDHPFLRDLVESLPAHVAAMPDAPSVAQSGPYYLTRVLRRHPEVTVFPPAYFYPYQWHERWRRNETFPAAYAVHHYTLSARAAELPRPRSAPGMTEGMDVLVAPSVQKRPRALEWVLEGLCHQTLPGFSVGVVTQPGEAEVESLIGRFRSRLDVRAIRGEVGIRDDSARVLLLAGDCLPDPDVVAAHAAVGHRQVIAYGMRRRYPARKLYPFRAPLDYPGILWHAQPDHRQADPSCPPPPSWKAVISDCFSVPGAAVTDPSLMAALREGNHGARRLVRELAAAGLGSRSLWPRASVTHLLADDMSGTPYAFPGPSVLYRANGSARRRPAQIEVVLARSGGRRRAYAHDDYPPAEFVRPVEGPPANVGSRLDAHPRRFHFRVIDPLAGGETVEIAWYTLRADRTDYDRPENPALTLRRARRGSHVFLSPPVIVAVDDAGETHCQIRRADMSGAVAAEYRPATCSPAVTVTVPVFRRRPDERMRLEALLVNYGGAATMDWAVTQLRCASIALAAAGIRLELGPLRLRALPRGRWCDEQATIDDLLPITPGGTVTVVFGPGPTTRADGASAWSAPNAGGDRHFVFVEAGTRGADSALRHELLETAARHSTPIGTIGRYSGPV